MYFFIGLNFTVYRADEVFFAVLLELASFGILNPEAGIQYLFSKIALDINALIPTLINFGIFDSISEFISKLLFVSRQVPFSSEMMPSGMCR